MILKLDKEIHAEYGTLRQTSVLRRILPITMVLFIIPAFLKKFSFPCEDQCSLSKCTEQTTAFGKKGLQDKFVATLNLVSRTYRLSSNCNCLMIDWFVKLEGCNKFCLEVLLFSNAVYLNVHTSCSVEHFLGAVSSNRGPLFALCIAQLSRHSLFVHHKWPFQASKLQVSWTAHSLE